MNHRQLLILMLTCGPLALLHSASQAKSGGAPASEDAHLRSTRDQWVLRVVKPDGEIPLVGASVWSSYELGEEHYALPEAITNVYGEAAIQLAAIRELRPIEQASVWISAYVAHSGYITDSTGARADNYDGFDASDESGTPTKIILQRGRSISGRVLDAKGVPLYGAEVAAGVWNRESGEWTVSLDSSSYLQTTEAGGHFSFELAGQSVRDLVATHPSAGTTVTQLASEAIREVGPEGVELRLVATEFKVRGTVHSTEGKLLGRPQLSVYSDSDESTPFHWMFDVPVDALGQFNVALPFGGPWSVSTCDIEVQTFDGSAKEVQLQLPGLYAVIQVRDEFGAPVRTSMPSVHALIATPAGLRPDYRGLQSSETSSVFRSWIYPTSSGGGVWTCRLPRPGIYSLSRVVTLDDRTWSAETTFTLEPGAVVVNASLDLLESAQASSVGVTWLDELGVPIPEWHGSLLSIQTGLELDSITAQGSSYPSCFGPIHSEIYWRAGSYRLRIEPTLDGYQLPVEATIQVQPNVANEFTLQSPGKGGRVVMRSSNVNSESNTRRTLELTHVTTARTLPPHFLYRTKNESELRWSPTPTGGDPTSSKLLEPGEWTWRIHEDGEEVDAGSFQVVAGELTSVVVKFGE